MKIIIPTVDTKATLNSSPSTIYGHAKSIVIYDTNTTEFKDYVFPENVKSCHIGHDLKEIGVDAVIAHSMCKLCYQNLAKQGLEIWRDDGSVTVREAFQKFVLGGTFTMQEPDNFICSHQKSVVHEGIELEHVKH